MRTRARVLTKDDFEQRSGVLTTLEGTVTFAPGDYLAIRIQGEEYRISAKTMAETKRLVQENVTDSEGFDLFETTTTVHAQ